MQGISYTILTPGFLEITDRHLKCVKSVLDHMSDDCIVCVIKDMILDKHRCIANAQKCLAG